MPLKQKKETKKLKCEEYNQIQDYEGKKEKKNITAK